MEVASLDGDVVCIPKSVTRMGDTIERLPKRSVLFALRAVALGMQYRRSRSVKPDEIGISGRVLQFIARTGMLDETHTGRFAMTEQGERFIAKYTR